MTTLESSLKWFHLEVAPKSLSPLGEKVVKFFHLYSHGQIFRWADILKPRKNRKRKRIEWENNHCISIVIPQFVYINEHFLNCKESCKLKVAFSARGKGKTTIYFWHDA